MHLTITARNDGTGDIDGMTLGELEGALARIRLNGGQDDTRLDVRTNRAHRVRQVTADVDETTAPTVAAGPSSSDTHSRACVISYHPHGGQCSTDCPTCHVVGQVKATTKNGKGLGSELPDEGTVLERTRPAGRAVVDSPQA